MKAWKNSYSRPTCPEKALDEQTKHRRSYQSDNKKTSDQDSVLLLQSKSKIFQRSSKVFSDLTNPSTFKQSSCIKPNRASNGDSALRSTGAVRSRARPTQLQLHLEGLLLSDQRGPAANGLLVKSMR